MTTASRRAHALTGVLLALAALALPVASRAEVGVSITIAPPVLPVYVQPEIPGDGYIWTPGYWAWGPDGYYWVPGTWVMPPMIGFLWTPGWWGWSGGFYGWNAGYWGPHIGFYGGVNYGFGYTGRGYEGGRWEGNRFYYNQTVNNVSSTNIRNVYSRTVVNNVRVNNVSYNGGSGGIRAEPNREELSAARETHQSATSAQLEHVHAASSNRELLASVNHGHPAIAASARPAQFSGHGVVAARGASPAPGSMTSHVAPNHAGERASSPSRASESPQRFGQNHAAERPSASNAPPTRPAPAYRQAPAQHAYQPPAQHTYQPPSQHASQPPAQHAYQPAPQPHYAQPRPAAPMAAAPQQRPQGRPEPREEHPHR